MDWPKFSKATAAAQAGAVAAVGTAGTIIALFGVPEDLRAGVPWWGYALGTLIIGGLGGALAFIRTYYAAANEPDDTTARKIAAGTKVLAEQRKANK